MAYAAEGAAPVTRRGSVRPSVTRRTPFRAEDWFSGEVLHEARRYARPLHRLKLVASFAEFAALIAFVGTHAAPRLLDAVGLGAWPLEVVLVVAALSGVMAIVGAPASAYVQLSYDRRWGLSTQTAGRWLADQAKQFLVSTILLSALLLPVWWAVRTTDLWWLYGWAGFMAVQMFAAFVYPVVIMPRFNKFTPLPDGELRRRIEAVAERAETQIEGVYTMDASKRTRRGNAFVAGFGPTKRVVLFDTILDFPPATIEQIVAHEIGHYRLKHIVKTVPLIGVLFLVTFIAIDVVARWDPLLSFAGVDRLSDPGALPVFLAVLGLCWVGLTLIQAWHTRTKEREADLEALELLGDPIAFLDVWRRMVPADKVELEPSWWTKLNHSHPEVGERMAFAEAWAGANGVPFHRPPPLGPDDIRTDDDTSEGAAPGDSDSSDGVPASAD